MISRLKEFRTREGLSQNALSQLVRMHPAQMCQIERGAPTSKATATKIALALNAPVLAVFPEFNDLREGRASVSPLSKTEGG